VNSVKHGNNQPNQVVVGLKSKRIHSTILILDKNGKKSTFFQENETYPPKEGVSNF
jgi:hypothetical protein